MSLPEIILPVSIYVFLSTCINSFLAPFWPPLAVLSPLPSIAVFFMARESRGGVVLMMVLLVGMIAEIFSYAPFGTYIFYAAALFLLAGLWIDVFSSATLWVMGFLSLVPLVDYLFIGFIRFLSQTAVYGNGMIVVLVVSIPLNMALYYAYTLVVPLRETEDVE